ncbi:hypothetical protein NHX12_008305 [Muraenolepis orangiensis]|uniref:Uncharacterized protein n=1 Tax=Muraenolepis orangiensis TaxID=630683 RepID=A0A9Q0IA24_9TELE|nr:hypothetical protein NHX12_008305 [Muraenolepis orangiensis]
MHRNLLLPCDHLPLEIQQKTVSKQKDDRRMTETAAEQTAQEQEDEEEEFEYYYKPVEHSQIPFIDVTMEQSNTQDGAEQNTPVLSTNEPVVKEMPITNTKESDIQQEHVLPEVNCECGDVQPVEEAQNENSTSPYSDSGGDEREQRDDLPRRERRAPKFFTYDQLGTPTCYSAAHGMLCQYQPSLFREGQPVTMWTNPFKVFQPLYVQGY